jgi:hypothetical protein
VAVSEVVVAVSIEPRRCGRARKHGRGREYQKSKFPCHGRGSFALTSETIDQSAACSKRRIRMRAGTRRLNRLAGTTCEMPNIVTSKTAGPAQS